MAGSSGNSSRGLKLFIVESPGKLKTLRKILGRDWILEASVGHTTELAQDGEKRLGFDARNGKVETRYVPRGDRGRQVLAKLRQAARGVDQVFLATDPDREGEAIAWHLVEQLGLRNYRRVSYTQITEAAVRKALDGAGRIDLDLVSSQRARQCLDKWVGYEASPLLWNSTGGKSAGRVQSATLHLICERERERLAFKPEKYWVLTSSYGEGFEAVYEPPKPAAGARSAGETGFGAGKREGAPGDVDESARVRTEVEARRIEAIARANPHVVESRDEKEELRHPPPPLITSSLQQVAGARFRYSPKQTMQIAQKLYEGVNGKGLITYMRTDAVTLSPEFVAEARAWLRDHAPGALADRAPSFRVGADAQGAHEAIRPTSAELTPEAAAREYGLDREQLNVYRLIWERAIASQCKPARIAKARIVVACADTRWVARGSVIVDPGYLKFWKNTEDERELPRLKSGQTLKFLDVKSEARQTQPPSRFSEPRLVQLMEKKGIGRPSTYASTIATLKDREYVVLEKGLLAPTPLGMATDEALGRALPELVDTDFTAKMEADLDRIAEGKLQWEEYLCRWNESYFAPAIDKAREVLGISAERMRASAVARARSAASRPAAGGGGGGDASAPSSSAATDASYAAAGSREARGVRAKTARGKRAARAAGGAKGAGRGKRKGSGAAKGYGSGAAYRPGATHGPGATHRPGATYGSAGETTYGSSRVVRPTGGPMYPAARPITGIVYAPAKSGPGAAAGATSTESAAPKPGLSGAAASAAETSSSPEALIQGQARALEEARRTGAVPSCTAGHGPLELRISKKGSYYWRCARAECESWSWFKDLSERRCPDCGEAMEKIRSEKVTGGHFLKCARGASHAHEVVLFLDSRTGQWSPPRPRTESR